MKIYLAGPMSGIEDWNHPKFHEVSAQLRNAGHEVWNPAENDEDEIHEKYGLTPGDDAGAARYAFLRHDFGLVLQADLLVVLPGWERSIGANAEVFVAHMVGVPVRPWDDKIGRIDFNADLLVPDTRMVNGHMVETATRMWANPEKYS